MSASGNYGMPPPGYGTAQPPSYQGQSIVYGQKVDGKPGSVSPSGSQDPLNGDRFEYVRTGPKYHDVWATFLFLADLIGFIVLSVVGLMYLAQNGLSSSDGTNSNTGLTPVPDGAQGMLIAILTVTTVIGALLCFVYILLMQNAGRMLIKITFIGSIAMYFGMGILYIAIGAWLAAVLYIIIGIISVLMYVWWRHRIPLAALIMETVCVITRSYPSTYAITVLSLILQTAYALLWSATLAGTFAKFQNSQGVVNLVYVFLLFSLFWTSQILSNILHVTIAGVVSTYYFLYGTSAMPSNPTLGSAKRAFTSSFGPIAFGSLIIAIIQTLRALLRQAARDGSAIAAIADCFLSCIEGLAQYFNSYAYVQVAIYGKSFCEAARDTWTMIKTTGVDAIANDSLVGTALGMGTLLIGLIMFTIAYVWGLAAFSRSADWDVLSGYVLVVAFIVLIIGLLMMSVVTMVVDSAVKTTFVCLAEDPAALARTKPELYQKFREVYPEIQWRV